MLINRWWGGDGGAGGVEQDAVPACAAQLMCLGCLFAGLSVSQQCLIALLSGVWFSCTWTLSQEILVQGRGEKKCEDHLPMLIGEWESEIEAVADM